MSVDCFDVDCLSCDLLRQLSGEQTHTVFFRLSACFDVECPFAPAAGPLMGAPLWRARMA